MSIIKAIVFTSNQSQRFRGTNLKLDFNLHEEQRLNIHYSLFCAADFHISKQKRILLFKKRVCNFSTHEIQSGACQLTNADIEHVSLLHIPRGGDDEEEKKPKEKQRQ